MISVGRSTRRPRIGGDPDDYDLTARVPHEEERRRVREQMPRTLASYLCAGVTTLASPTDHAVTAVPLLRIHTN